MANKNNRRTQMTKLMLKTSLIELMHNKCINQITIKELCENADLNRSTFYLHYTDQYALLRDIEEEIINKTKEHLINIDSNTHSLLYVKAFLDYVKENRDIFHTLLCLQENTSFQTKFIHIAMEHIKDNILLNCPDEYSTYIFHFLMHGNIHIVIEWIKSDFNISSENLSQLIFDLSNHSLCVFDS